MQIRRVKVDSSTRSPMCWRCIFPLSLGSVQVGKGDLPDTSNPGSPLQLCPAPPPILFARPRHRVLGADGHDGRQPFARLYGQSGGLQYQSRQDRYGDREKGRQAGERRFYHVHWYKYPLTYWLNIITSAGCLEGGDMDIAYLSEIDPTCGQQPHHYSERKPSCLPTPSHRGVRG